MVNTSKPSTNSASLSDGSLGSLTRRTEIGVETAILFRFVVFDLKGTLTCEDVVRGILRRGVVSGKSRDCPEK